jgi:uncharacterized membrane protein
LNSAGIGKGWHPLKTLEAEAILQYSMQANVAIRSLQKLEQKPLERKQEARAIVKTVPSLLPFF